MSRYLLALDLDGTLLNTQKHISERTKLVLQSMMQLGNDVVIATGRPKRTSLSYHRQLGLRTPLVNLNGAFVHDPHGVYGELHLPIPYQTVKAALGVCYEIGIENVLAEVGEQFYLHKYGPINLALSVESFSAVAVGDLRYAIREDVTSFAVYPKLSTVDVLVRELRKRFGEALTIREWGDPQRTIEILNKAASKARGVAYVADQLGYEPEQIIAFGDEMNDIDMLLFAGKSVAMGNARDAVKSIADFVTDSCDREGIAKFLEQYVYVQQDAASLP
ncbi:Cof-type HAD-IIB family hydrolase [Sulfoacidibacillus thermotolerans]|uniref:Phosphatase n=1 Tax=Sulfoacidibacillus thermotolerans TaxID=1765684 RepID=A0A2U3D9Z4_SULT2|nr:Cof-type HAD-IIB family hydrolase [Sulfoacidibacillus thermotolerans]PWI58107.1 hypothetical protein BM613_05435 [Sulfoacidibacillus thermotolerans]